MLTVIAILYDPTTPGKFGSRRALGSCYATGRTRTITLCGRICRAYPDLTACDSSSRPTLVEVDYDGGVCQLVGTRI